MTATATMDVDTFRHVLGHFASGVTVVTGGEPDAPAGFTCQSFSSLSLDPPLVVVLPHQHSSSWTAIARSGRFCVNVLAENQEELSAGFARRSKDKFAGVAWMPSPLGSPVIDGVSAWIDCTIAAVHPGGDHFIVVGVVTHCEAADASPLLYHRGRYQGTRPCRIRT
jgi:3-hydroxy-9,10-secoandrosta-1,3,5(10)-triene-9,17-dione monooxygenase reductase component